MSERFDVAVVGAGPAGAQAARKLAQSGARVVLLERARIPRDKPCGGGLTPKAYRQLDVPIDDLVLARPHSVWLGGHGVEPFALGDERARVWMVRRSQFDERLVDYAARAGVAVRDGVLVGRVTPGAAASIETDAGTIRASAVVAADGAESRIARQLGLRRHRDQRVVVALEIEARGEYGDGEGRALVDFDVPHGYAWVFPKGEHVNVGIGSFDPSAFPTLRAQLDAFVRRCGVRFDETPRVIGHRIPIGGIGETWHRENVLLAGDAAGVADAMFAEGIAYALQTGTIAAGEVGRLLAGETSDLAGYTRYLERTLLRDLRAWRAIGAIVYRFPSLSMRALKASPRAQRLAASAIAGDRSFSKLWVRGPAA